MIEPICHCLEDGNNKKADRRPNLDLDWPGCRVWTFPILDHSLQDGAVIITCMLPTALVTCGVQAGCWSAAQL